jgi:hypothetical protein
MYQEVSMLSPKESRKVLLKMFRQKYIANLDELFRVLDTHSRMSVFRRLKPLGYLSSFTDAGGYYTLQDIPKFDPLGLWFYQGVGFSRAGTLKSTVVDIVHSSEAGKTPTELINLLRLNVANSLHNTLHGLIEGKQLKRYRLQGLALYTSIDSEIADKQIVARREKIKSGLPLPAVMSMEVTIAVLAEALRAGKVLVAASTVAARLNAQGMPISVDEVQQVFSQYGLEAEKKTAEQP